MAVVASATGAAVFGLSGVAAGLAGGALLGAGAGALYSGITGDGNILNSALTGALLGGTAGGLGAAFAPAVTAPTALASAPVSTALVPTANAITAVPAAQAAGLTAGTGATGGISAAAKGAAGLSAAAPTVAAAPSLASLTTPVVTGSLLPAGYGAGSAAAGMSGSKMLGYGLAGTTALSLLGGRQQGPGAGQMPDPGMVRPYEYSSTPNEPTGIYPSPYATAEYNEAGNPILDTRERNYFNQNFAAMQPYSAKTGTVNPNLEPVTMAASGGLMQKNLQKGLFGRKYADGGITYDAKNQLYSGLPSIGGDSNHLSAELIAQLTPQYQAANPNQFAYDPAQQRYSAATPTMAQLNAYKAEQDRMSAQQMPPFMGFFPGAFGDNFAAGGNVQGYNLGGYSDGGRLLKGPGDGVSDDIPAVIGDRQPARLADGEFVIPARIVSEIGNGSTDAGAKRLYAMMDRIQSGRKKTIGKKNIAKDTKAKKHLLA
jgi:hypothetical protein